MYMGTMYAKPTDTWWVSWIRRSGIFITDYTRVISNLRASGYYGDDDKMADELIKHHAQKAAWIGGLTATVPALIKILLGTVNPTAGNIGYGVSFAVGGMADLGTLFKQQSTMILKLAEIYDQLPYDEDERVDIATYPFGTALAGAIINKVIAVQILKLGAEALVTPASAAQWVAEAAAKVAAQGGDANAVVNAARVAAQNPGGKAAADGFITAFILKKLLPYAGNMEAQLTLAVRGLSFTMRSFLAFALVYGLNKKATEYLGKRAKMFFKAKRVPMLGKNIFNLSNDYKAKAVLWILLTKNVFPKMDLESAKMYAAILHTQMPLIKTDKIDEREAIFADYEKHQDKLIEKYLNDLNYKLSINAKLYLMKLLLSGIYMKSQPTFEDDMLISSTAARLDLYFTGNALNQLKRQVGGPNMAFYDYRYSNYLRFQYMMTQLANQVSSWQLKLGGGEDPGQVTIAGAPVKKWQSGKLILEEFKIAGPVIEFNKEAQRQKSLTPELIEKADKIANEITNSPDMQHDMDKIEELSQEKPAS